MKRSISEKLAKWAVSRNRKPLLLQGARQIGKTYSLRAFGAAQFERAHYVNFEGHEDFMSAFNGSLKPEKILRDLELLLETSINPKSDLLILDEIQNCSRALTSLKYFSEDLPGLAICAAGSLLGVRMGASSFPVGKVDALRMYPMAFEEFLDAVYDSTLVNAFKATKPGVPLSQTLHEQLWQAFKSYLVVGGMPAAVAAFAAIRRDDEAAAFQEARRIQLLLLDHHAADMARHCGKENSMHIERLWRNVPAQLARDTNGSAPKYVFKGVLPGIKGYERLSGVIDWLEAAGLVIRVPIVNSGLLPFSAYSKENTFKLFVFDIGMLGALSNLPVKTLLDYSFGSYKGYMVENAVVQEFTASGRTGCVCWREGTAEIEFLTVIGESVIPVEVKSGHVTQAKSLGVFAKKYNPPFCVVMSARNAGFNEESLRRYYPLYLASQL